MILHSIRDFTWKRYLDRSSEFSFYSSVTLLLPYNVLSKDHFLFFDHLAFRISPIYLHITTIRVFISKPYLRRPFDFPISSLFLLFTPSKDHFLQPLTTRSLSLFAFMAVPCAVENYSLIGLANQIAFYKIRHDRYMYTNKYLSVSVTNAIVPSNDTHSRSLGKVVEQLLDNLYDSLVHLFAA